MEVVNLSTLVSHIISDYLRCFYINLPVIALTATSVLFVRFTGHQKRKTDWTWTSLAKGLDLVGFLLFAPACIMLFLALEWGGVKNSWHSATIIGLLLGSAAIAVIFMFWEKRAGSNAMVPPALVSVQFLGPARCQSDLFPDCTSNHCHIMSHSLLSGRRNDLTVVLLAVRNPPLPNHATQDLTISA